MSLIDQIRKDKMSALRAHDSVAKNILSTLIGELETSAKRFNSANISDEDVITACKKLIKSNEETIAITKHISQRVELLAECEVLSRYIPKQLDEQQLQSIITELDAANISEVMKHLKANYNSQYDGKLAASIAMQKFK